MLHSKTCAQHAKPTCTHTLLFFFSCLALAPSNWFANGKRVTPIQKCRVCMWDPTFVDPKAGIVLYYLLFIYLYLYIVQQGQHNTKGPSEGTLLCTTNTLHFTSLSAPLQWTSNEQRGWWLFYEIKADKTPIGFPSISLLWISVSTGIMAWFLFLLLLLYY